MDTRPSGGGTGGTADTEFPPAAAGTDNDPSPVTTRIYSFGMVYDGATWDFMRGTAADGVLVNLGTNNDVTVTGTVTATPSAVGAGTAATAGRVVLASDSPGSAELTNIGAGEYETVAASQTDQVLGGTGAIGDFISHLIIKPATTSPGAVALLDNATSITIFPGGASSVSNLIPFAVPLAMKSVSGAWKITTGADVSVIAVGNFSA